MLCAGLGWLTFLSPSLGRALIPDNLAPGIIGEGALTVWLLAFGVKAPRVAGAGGRRRSVAADGRVADAPMTRASNARVAGAVLLVYIATGVTSMVLSGRIVAGADGTAAKLASMVQHAPLVRVNILLTLLQAAYAMVLAVTLFALTRDEDRDLALMGLCCRVARVWSRPFPRSGRWDSSRWRDGRRGPCPGSGRGAGGRGRAAEVGGWTGLIAATCFALGSALFWYLLLRARSIPVPLAWLPATSRSSGRTERSAVPCVAMWGRPSGLLARADFRATH